MADFSITGEVRLNSDPAEKSTSKWTVAAGQMIADFAKQASSKLAEVVKSGVDYNATMESYLTNFKVMLGSEEAAATKLSEIRKMAASTPFSLDDLTSGTQTLLQFGIAADDTTGVMQRLGDISLGNAEKLQTLTRAYGKMSSAQKVTLENVNMMIDAGFNPLNQICDATGESMSDLYKRISDGKVSFSELEAAVEAATSQGGQFYNGMLEASQTFNGRLSTLTDNTKALLGALSDSLYSSLSDLLPVANDVVLELTDAFTEGGVPAMLDTAAELLDNFADGLIQKIPDAVSAVSDLLTELLNYLADHQDDIFDTGVQAAGKSHHRYHGQSAQPHYISGQPHCTVCCRAHLTSAGHPQVRCSYADHAGGRYHPQHRKSGRSSPRLHRKAGGCLGRKHGRVRPYW